MNPTVQIALTIFYVIWLVAILVVLILWYRSSQARGNQVEELEKLLITESQAAHKAAQKSADAAHLLAQELTKEKKR